MSDKKSTAATDDAEQISHFSIIRTVNNESQPAIYVARDTRLNRTVVLIQYTVSGEGHRPELDYFTAYVRKLASLSSPHLPVIYEFENDRESAYAAAEYIEGRTLAEAMKNAPLPIDTALQTIIQMCGGIHILNQAGVPIDRLTAADIVLDAANRVRISPLALFRPGMSFREICDREEPFQAGATNTVPNIGGLIFEILTGFSPEAGDARQPSLARYRPDLNLFQPIIDKALHPNPKLRYGDAGQIRDAVALAWQEYHIRASETKYRNVVEQANDGICIIQDKKLKFINQKLAEMVGYTVDEGLDTVFTDYIPPDQLALIGEKYEKQLTGVETLQRYDTWLLHKDGSKLPVEINAGLTALNKRPAILAIVRDIADRREAEEALRESRRMLATLMSNLPGIAYRCRNDRDWTMEFISDGCLALTGHKPADLIDNTVLSYNELIHPDDRQKVWDSIQEKIDRKEPFQIVYRLETKKGGSKWVWEQGCGVFDDDGNLTALEGFIIDISENRRTEDHLRLLSSIVKESDEGIALADLDGNLQYVNQTFADMHGYKPEELLRKNLKMFHSPEQLPTVEKAIETLKTTGRFSGEIWHMRRDGTEFPAYMNNSLLQDKASNVTRMIAIMRDITRRVEAARALEESEERFRQLSDAAEEGIAIHDRGTIVDANEAMARLFGYTSSEMIGTSLKPLVTPDSWQIIKSNISTAYAAPYEIIGISKNGLVFTCQVVGRPYTYRGKTLGVAVFRDISVLKEAEQKAQAAVEQLNATLSALPDLFFEVDRQGRIYDFRAAKPQLLYRTPEEFLGEDIDSFLPHRAVAAIRKAIEEAARKGRSSGITYSLDIKDETYWFELSIASRGAPDGPDSRFVALVRDVTERKRNEEELKKTTRELRAERKILTEKNIALNEVLEHLESQRQSHRRQVFSDIEEALQPFMKKLKNMFGEERADKYEELEANYNAILGKDLDIFRDRYARLTSRESEICDFIKEGMSSKQISEKLNLSILTVQKHREQIRKKLDITNRSVNLATYLRSHQDSSYTH